LRELAQLTKEGPDGTILIEWVLPANAKVASGPAALPVLEGRLAATSEVQSEQILGLATWLNMGQIDRAARWFEATLSELRNKSPRQLVAEGHADGVLDYMLGLCTGTIG